MKSWNHLKSGQTINPHHAHLLSPSFHQLCYHRCPFFLRSFRTRWRFFVERCLPSASTFHKKPPGPGSSRLAHRLGSQVHLGLSQRTPKMGWLPFGVPEKIRQKGYPQKGTNQQPGGYCPKCPLDHWLRLTVRASHGEWAGGRNYRPWEKRFDAQYIAGLCALCVCVCGVLSCVVRSLVCALCVCVCCLCVCVVCLCLCVCGVFFFFFFFFFFSFFFLFFFLCVLCACILCVCVVCLCVCVRVVCVLRGFCAVCSVCVCVKRVVCLCCAVWCGVACYILVLCGFVSSVVQCSAV